MQPNLLYSIILIIVCILFFLLVQTFLLKKFKSNDNYIVVQYVVFIFSLLYFADRDDISANTLLIIMLPIVLLFLSFVVEICVERSKKHIDIAKSVSDIFKSNLVKYYIYIVLSPILEELFFRYFLLENVLSDKPIVIRVIIPSAIFALSHLKPKAVIEAFIGGIILSCIYIYTKNIFLVIGIHISYNSLCINIKSK